MGEVASRPSVSRRGQRELCRALRLSVLTLVTTWGAAACSERSRAGRLVPESWWQGGRPDEAPLMLNQMLPFQYPVAQYLRRMQGNVTLRLFVDADGRVVSDSTRIEGPSGISAFDSAALAGAAELRFRPARRRGVAVPVALLFPVHFRHPEVPAIPVDTSRDPLGPRS